MIKVQPVLGLPMALEKLPTWEAYQFENKVGEDTRPKWVKDAHGLRAIEYHPASETFSFMTARGIANAQIGDWIVKDDLGAFHWVTPEVFKKWFIALP